MKKVIGWLVRHWVVAAGMFSAFSTIVFFAMTGYAWVQEVTDFVGEGPRFTEEEASRLFLRQDIAVEKLNRIDQRLERMDRMLQFLYQHLLRVPPTPEATPQSTGLTPTTTGEECRTWPIVVGGTVKEQRVTAC